jgi:hypothetical protein
MLYERMKGYLPSAISSITEFHCVLDGESQEFNTLNIAKDRVIADAYLPTMSEQRIAQWEKYLGIRPLESATLDDRRNIIIARIRGQGKLNTHLINTIVKTVTGQGCKCWLENNTLHVSLLLFDDSKISMEDAITNVTNELALKLPAHIGLTVDIAYVRWDEVNAKHGNWTGVRTTYGTWEDVILNKTYKVNMLDTSKLDELQLR